MKYAQYALWAALGLITLGCLYGVANHCSGQHQSYQNHHTTYLRLPGDFFFSLYFLLKWGLGWAADNSSGIQAIGAIVITIFTGALTWTSWLQWKAANSNVEVLLKLERPLVILKGFNVHNRNPQPGGNINNWILTLDFRNVGRTPAFIYDLIFKIVDRDTLGQFPDYTGFSSLAVVPVLATGGKFVPQPFGVGGRTGKLVVFGRLIYKDVAGMAHSTGFAMDIASYMPTGSTYGGDSYNYHT